MLGAVQGLTEFIPISSSGHLVLVPAALGWAPPGLTFDVLLHLASLLALVTYFGKDLVATGLGVLSGDRSARKLPLLLLVGTVPAAVAGLALADYFEGTFTDARSSAVQLLVTALILVAGERALTSHSARSERTGRPLRTMEDLGWKDALAIGCAQAISILPGISRSGATIATGLGLKTTRDDSARFAFLLAVPALAGATLVELPGLGASRLGIVAGAAGFATSLAFSYLSIAALIRYLRTRTLYPFAAYCLVAGLIFFAVV